MTCSTCDKLTADIARAEANGETEKARVLRAVLMGHRDTTCCNRQLYHELWRNAEVVS